jgi:hypothetical protein
MDREELKQIFIDNFDCYVNCKDVVLAMTEVKFVEVVNKIILNSNKGTCPACGGDGSFSNPFDAQCKGIKCTGQSTAKSRH